MIFNKSKSFFTLLCCTFLFFSCEKIDSPPQIDAKIKSNVSLDILNSNRFVQRSLSNDGEVYITGISSKNFSEAQVKFKNKLGGAESNWLSLTKDSTNFSGKFLLKGGGYIPQIRLFDNQVMITDTSINIRFNVGEVFGVIGHSLAEGQQPYTLNNYNKEWCEIVTWDWNPNLPVFWGRLAENLKNRLKVPIMIYNTGIGGSTSLQWGNSAYGLPFESAIFGWKDRYPFVIFENRVLKDFRKSGIRAIFVMHGENDIGLSEEEIVQGTKNYIKKTRELLAKNDLTFYIAKSNRGSNNVNEVKVRNAQKRILQEINYTIVGANLEVLTSQGGFRWDGTHFNFLGIEQAAVKWNEAILLNHFTQINPLKAVFK